MTTTASPVLAPSGVTEAWFAAVLRHRGSPAASEAAAVYAAFVAGHVDPEIALGQFDGESSYGREGFATVTRNWGNLTARTPAMIPVWYPGAVAFQPGNGYTYAAFGSWLAGAMAYSRLLGLYGRMPLGRMAARWLGAPQGSVRANDYVGNILAAIAANRADVPLGTPSPPTSVPPPTGTPLPVTGGPHMPAPIITAYPEPKIGTTPPGTKRWAVAEPYDELKTLVGPGLYVLSALVFFPPGGTRSGTFIQTATVPNFLLRAADVTFVETAGPPTPLDPGFTPNADPTLTAAFAAKHGEDGTHYVADIIKAQLHPNPARWYVDPGADQSVGDQERVSDLYRQAKAEAFIRGEVSWGEERSYLGYEAQGLINAGAVDATAVLAILQGTGA